MSGPQTSGSLWDPSPLFLIFIPAIKIYDTLSFYIFEPTVCPLLVTRVHIVGVDVMLSASFPVRESNSTFSREGTDVDITVKKIKKKSKVSYRFLAFSPSLGASILDLVIPSPSSTSSSACSRSNIVAVSCSIS